MRLILVILIGIVFIGCGSPEMEMVGKWKFIMEVESGVEVIIRPPIEDGAIIELEFLSNREVINLRNGDPFGLIGCKFKVKEDSIFRTCAYDDSQSLTIGAFFKLTNDTLMLEEGSLRSYYLRNE
jgi:hypothetical protein